MNRPSADSATLVDRLRRIERLENELMQKVAAQVTSDFHYSDMFVLGALRRTLAQSKGFRDLIISKNFPCAAGILRLQIDTAMRINALGLVQSMNAYCEAVLSGTKFNSLKDASGNKLTDAFLRKKLAESYPWISSVYEGASDFVHLSGKHFYNSILSTDDATRTIRFVISGTDPDRPDEAYFEAIDAFLEITKLTGLLLLGYFSARSQAPLQSGGAP